MKIVIVRKEGPKIEFDTDPAFDQVVTQMIADSPKSKIYVKGVTEISFEEGSGQMQVTRPNENEFYVRNGLYPFIKLPYALPNSEFSKLSELIDPVAVCEWVKAVFKQYCLDVPSGLRQGAPMVFRGKNQLELVEEALAHQLTQAAAAGHTSARITVNLFASPFPEGDGAGAGGAPGPAPGSASAE